MSDRSWFDRVIFDLDGTLVRFEVDRTKVTISLTDGRSENLVVPDKQADRDAANSLGYVTIGPTHRPEVVGDARAIDRPEVGQLLGSEAT